MTDETPRPDDFQEDMPDVNYNPLRGSLEAEGVIGGESQAVYAFSVVEGQTLTVRLSSAGNKADFYVSCGPHYYNAEVLELGEQSVDKGSRSLSGKVPRSGVCFVGVIAELGEVPKFRLQVTIE
ncbi:MAG TPA: hypothetical protein VF668_23040 [Pyrinomonadaceae bacterium]